MRSRSSAAASAGSSSWTFARFKWPTKWVSIDFGRLTNSSQWMLLGCFKPSSTPTVTWVRKPSHREYTGAQTTEENLELTSTCRLTTTNTRCFRGSLARSGVPLLVTKNKSPRCTYLDNAFGSPWNSSASACSLSSSAILSRIAAS